MTTLLTRLFSNSYIRYILNSIVSVGPIPKHVAFIMDGNRRFARIHNKTTIQGHVEGSLKLKDVNSILLIFT